MIRRHVARGALLLLLLLLAAATAPAAQEPAGQTPAPQEPVVPAPGAGEEMVVLLHGLGRTRLSMIPLEWALEREGYRVVNLGYSSYTAGISGIGAALALRIDSAVAEHRPARVHLVGHSLGTVLTRWILANRRPDRVGRVVMLAPPNRGSASADRFSPWLGWLLRPLPELATDTSSTARRLGAPLGVEVGIVAGEFDGKVTLAETELPGAERVVVPASHTFLMARPDVQRLVLRFLREGSFSRSQMQDGPPPPARGDGPPGRPGALAQPAGADSSRVRVDQ